MNTQASTLIIACGAIAHELVAVTRANDWPQIDIQCLPAEWHNFPDRIAPAIEQKINSQQHAYKHIFVAYGDCGTGGQLDRVLAKYDIERLPGAHCYEFFSSSEVFNHLCEAELGTFYLTDYMVDHFDRLILKGLGISKHPELRDMYFGNYTRVLYLAQNDSDERRQLAEKAAKALGLRCDVHITGMQPFANMLQPLKTFSV